MSELSATELDELLRLTEQIACDDCCGDLLLSIIKNEYRKREIKTPFQRSLEIASKEVAGWPQWKQGLLESSARPTCPPRRPINRSEAY